MKRPAPTPLSVRLGTAMAPWRARWEAMSPRERYLSTLAASAVAILLVWAIALAPALRSLQKVQVQRQQLDAQLQQMLALQAEARQLAAQPRIGREAALRALQESVTALGSGAQMQVSGERAVINLRAIPAASVASWLGQARTNARVAPVEMRLVRSPARAAAPAAAAAPSARPGVPPTAAPPAAARTPTNDDIRWDGTIVLALPAA
ncbi:type II secretion system protein M [Xylophilus rhododendri]|uniref:Type II secretion system protein M n=1 Tax=Xylophilus rhododendri TaxID=2697032 RepID=A0A857J5K4_9BURK|nr:type II secretion system protein GspM [Xylophilus rhododendri]QHI98302.1 type II secretion system protein M [Xylophilus rhododendri]